MTLQIEKEKVFCNAASSMGSEKILIVCDHGTLDNKAYMNDTEFSAILKELDVNEVKLMDNYDAVFHLVIAAKGAEVFYTTANNTARTETIKEAAMMDDSLISAWTWHPHFRVIDNSTDFEGKMRRLIAEIAFFLANRSRLKLNASILSNILI